MALTGLRRLGLGIVALGTLMAIAGLAVGMLSAADPNSKLPPEKQSMEDYANAFRQKGAAADKSKDRGAPLIAQDDPPAPTGMLGAVGAPMAGTIFTSTNAWAGWISPTVYVTVFAGAPAETPTQGMLCVASWIGANGRLDSGIEPSVRLINAPAPGGPLFITSYVGGQLTVTNHAGQTFRFNPALGTFD